MAVFRLLSSRTKAKLGIAHDGDADRCLGGVVDGHQIMAILAMALDATVKLRDKTPVATVMGNLVLEIARGMPESL